MNESTEEILELLTAYLKQYPDTRFTEALFNLNITEFQDSECPSCPRPLLKCNIVDDDREVLLRMLGSSALDNLQS